MKVFIAILCALYLALPGFGQQQDSGSELPAKVHHAEPLYIDLIRDLGARQGEKEWNIGGEAEERSDYQAYGSFIEYEFAPFNRLGMELEIPFEFYGFRNSGRERGSATRSRVESIKPAVQYTFLVSPVYQTSLAIGYIHRFNLHSFYTIRRENDVFEGNTFNPFFVAAKKWGTSIHSLINTGPQWEHSREEDKTYFSYQLNYSLYYMIPQTNNFLGVEVNQVFSDDQDLTVLRPQVKIAMLPNLALGLVAGIPVSRGEEGIGGMFRLIYEPPGREE